MNNAHPRIFSNALILQGDWEGGLANVALDLEASGKNVTKVVFHAGDWIYKWRKVPTVNFEAKIECFEEWLRRYVHNNAIDCIILYNQYRPYNKIGWDLAKELDIECLVLELGLLRPDYCSIYTRDLNHFDYLKGRWEALVKSSATVSEPEPPDRLAIMSTPCKMTQFAIFYAFSRLIAKFGRRYRHYQDQRSLSFRHHLVAGIRGMLRFQGREKQHRFDRVFSSRWSGKYFVVPLQVHSDSQITERSNFESMEQFIQLVSQSFLEFAPKNTKLVFKIHPMDRGYRDYHKLIRKLRASAGGSRIFYLDRIHLPTLLDHAKGCITINSSVGLSALIHGAPTLTLGSAAYDLKGLTYEGLLDDFWPQHGDVDEELVTKFVSLLKYTSQAQGVFYQKIFATPGQSKIVWPEEFKPLFCNKGIQEPAQTAELDPCVDSNSALSPQSLV
jgi:capsule polysaccharide modification protein KpsS